MKAFGCSVANHCTLNDYVIKQHLKYMVKYCRYQFSVPTYIFFNIKYYLNKHFFTVKVGTFMFHITKDKLKCFYLILCAGI